MMPQMAELGLAAYIDHTLLKPGADREAIEALCAEARKHAFASVCVHPVWIASARRLLEGSGVKVCTVVAFPHGETLAQAKADEARAAVEAGAEEIDMVAARSLIFAGDWAGVQAEVRRVAAAIEDKLLKVILESAALSDEQLIEACKAVRRAGAHFVKTSTGFGPGGASVEAVRLMRATVGPNFGVKASGGIRDAATARAMIEAGANRLGCSAGVALVRGEASSDDY